MLPFKDFLFRFMWPFCSVVKKLLNGFEEKFVGNCFEFWPKCQELFKQTHI